MRLVCAGQVDWHKGCALVHLLGALGLGEGAADVLPIYIGDDRTDEDAFRVLRERPAGGIGILVSSKARAARPVPCLQPHGCGENGTLLPNVLGFWASASLSPPRRALRAPRPACHPLFVVRAAHFCRTC